MSGPRSAASATRRIGPHSYRIEGDLFFWQPHGDVLAEHARGVVAVIQEPLG